MKFRFCLMTSLAASLVASATSAFAQEIRVTVDGERVHFRGQPPIEIDDRVLVPLRGVFEDLGAQVNWNPGNETVTARREGVDVKLRIGDTSAAVNGDPVRLDVPAQIIEGSTMVPLRFVGEALGDRVHWDEQTQTVSIITERGGFGIDHHDQGDYMPRRDRSEDVPPPTRVRERTYIEDEVVTPPPPVRQRIIEEDIPVQDDVTYESDTVIPVDINIDLQNCRPGERITTIVPSYPGLPPDSRISGIVREVGPVYGSRGPLLDIQFDSFITPSGHRYHIDGRAIPFNTTTVVRTDRGYFRAGDHVRNGFVRLDSSRRIGVRLSTPFSLRREGAVRGETRVRSDVEIRGGSGYRRGY